MAAGQNGSASQSKPDGYPSPEQAQRKTTKKKKRSSAWWPLTLLLRLGIWYALLTPFLHCPSQLSQLDDSSPRVCKPYLIARSHLEPHINPYYQTYAAPYVDIARPYAQTINDHVYIPASKVAKYGYYTYGAPALSQARQYSEKQWHEEVLPRLHSAQDAASRTYISRVDPYVQHATTVLSPYTDTVAAWNEKYVLPLYAHSKPFLSKTYTAGQEVLATTAFPLAQRAWSSTMVFVNGALWPTVTGLYSENVEPQLVKIGERLASYREGQKLRAVVEEVDSILDQQTSSTLTSSVEQVTSSQPTNSPTTSVAAEPTPSLTPEEKEAEIRERIASDLRTWQEKFAVAADNGVEDMSERIGEIVTSQIDGGVNKHGWSLLDALRTVVDQEISNVKIHITHLIEALPEDYAPEEEEKANADLLATIRKAGMTIRDRAHALREWTRSFDEELTRRVYAASASTLDVLDHIRSLGLQEIGMRWAWMDGVTYKDWAKYHEIRKQLDEWRNEVQETAITHPKIEEARTAVNDLLADGMSVAEEAAKELTRLKEVGKWKIQAREISENFDTRSEPPPSRVKPVPAPESDSLSEDNPGNEPVIANSFIMSEQSSELAHSVSDEPITMTEYAPAFTVTASLEQASDLQGSVEEHTADNAADEDIRDKEHTPLESSSATKVWGGVAAQAAPTNKPILDETSNDDYSNKVSENLQSLANEAGERLAEATKAVSEALLGPSSTQGYGEQAASVASEQYSLALAAASSVLYGTTPSPGEQFTSSAAARYRDAVSAASSAFYNVIPQPTTTGPLESIASIASSRLNEGLSHASAQYSSLVASVTQTPTEGKDPVLLDAQRRYYEAVGHAHDHYTAFLHSASEAVYGTPAPTPIIDHFNNFLRGADAEYSHVSSLASSSLAAVVSSASAAMATQTGSGLSSVLADASSRYSAAMSAASESLVVASASASSALHGTSTGTFESAVSAASEKWEDLVSKASEQVYGTPTPYVQQLLNRQVAQYQALESLVSELVVGKEPSFTESVMSRLRVAYETPYPAAAFSTASSYANDAYASASSYVAAATPLAALEEVLNVANEQLNSAVEAASIYVYGTPKGSYEQATSAAASAYSAASSQASAAIYGTQPSNLEAVRSQLDQAYSSAQYALSAAVYGTPTGKAESAYNAASGAYASATSIIAENVSAAGSMANEAYSHVQSKGSSLLSEQEVAFASATSRLAGALESAQARLAHLVNQASDLAGEAESSAASAASAASSTASSAAQKIRDEL